MSRLASWVGAGAALLWALTCVAWFDPVPRAVPGARPAWLAAMLAVAASFLGAVWVRARWTALRGPGSAGSRGGALLVVLLAFFFRLPLAWQGSVGYTTPDGSLSGIVALHARDGGAHHVFVPRVPYCGSLKSHLTAPLAAVIDPSRAFALASVLFYVLFVAALYRIGRLVGGEPVAVATGLYAAFAPAYVTHYSLSNDGNYVEVLALGTWALLIAIRWWLEEENRPTLALAAGLLLGIAFWSHILAVIHIATVGLVLLAAGWRGLRSWLLLALGGVVGAFPSLLWNARNGWQSFHYVLPGGQAVGTLESGPGPLGRAWLMAVDQWPVLLGYDSGYPPVVDRVLAVLAWMAVVLAVIAVAWAAKAALSGGALALRVLLVFTAVNLAVAVAALPHVPGNPRYVLFLMASLPVFLAFLLARGRLRYVMVALVALGAVGSMAQAPSVFRKDAEWRRFVADLESAGVRWCHTDFHLAAKINFVSEERVICSAKLGPSTTEYFVEYRERVEAARQAALIAVNPTAASKLERRLERLGVTWERRDLLKPVLMRLSRKVDPEELFPDRELPEP
ncbi:MAG TPA: glycosyltransferase family 39 protein [Vicinamibacteria bacterium]|nr:glycosyltransferase family 39 protein [Vicinamibacteria bacterium]